MFKWFSCGTKKHDQVDRPPTKVNTGVVELPFKVLEAIESASMVPRESGVLIVGLGEPFYFESINVAIRSRLAKHGLDENQLKLAAETLRRQVRKDVRESRKACRAANRSCSGGWCDTGLWMRH